MSKNRNKETIYKYSIKGYAINPAVKNARFTYDLVVDTDSTLNCASFPQLLINLALKTHKDQGTFIDPNSIVIEKLELLNVEDVTGYNWPLQA